MMWLSAAAAILMFPVQEDELEKARARIKELEAERDKLVKENERLKADVDSYREQCVETAKEIFELRQQLKTGAKVETKVETKPETKTETKPETKTDTAKTEVGPDAPLKGRVMFVDKENGFALLNIGKKEGVKIGYKFEIVREVKVEGQRQLQIKRLGVGEVVKLIGAEETHAKIKLVEGNIGDVGIEDEAIAFRKTGEATTTETKTETEKPKKELKVSGRTGDVYLLNFGGQDGAKGATIVYAYRNKKQVGRLRIDTVEKDYCIARVTEGEVFEGDLIEMQELKILIVGRIKHAHKKNGLYLDITADTGAKAGLRMKVTRKGKQVGTIILDKVEKFYSTAVVEGETLLEDLKEGDFVEQITE